MHVRSEAAPDTPSLAPADLHLARGSVQDDRNSEAPIPIAQAGANRTLPVSPMNRNASTSTMIPTALTTKNAPTAMARAERGSMTTQQRAHPQEPGRTRKVLDHTLQAVLGDAPRQVEVVEQAGPHGGIGVGVLLDEVSRVDASTLAPAAPSRM